jgi:hypothetical protein
LILSLLLAESQLPKEMIIAINKKRWSVENASQRGSE